MQRKMSKIPPVDRSLPTCEVCNHLEHEAGECKQCNCGADDIIYPSRRFGIRLIGGHWCGQEGDNGRRE
jgi:hypothetical protein